MTKVNPVRPALLARRHVARALPRRRMASSETFAFLSCVMLTSSVCQVQLGGQSEPFTSERSQELTPQDPLNMASLLTEEEQAIQ
jgi:hypothetical protein